VTDTRQVIYGSERRLTENSGVLQVVGALHPSCKTFLDMLPSDIWHSTDHIVQEVLK